MNVLRKHLDAWAAIMEECGISHWVYSPGSRNAPLLAALMRRPFFQLHEQIDERSAAYMAMGMAQQLNYPCGVLCTSGTAAANWLAAAAEAYYQRIPLLLVSADRPIEAVDNWMGQTIRQDGLFHRHIRGEWRVSDDLDSREQSSSLEGIFYEAITRSQTPIAGPVHVNFPMREPLYEGMQDQGIQVYEPKPYVWSKNNVQPVHEAQLKQALAPYSRIALVIGQMNPQFERKQAVESLNERVAVWADVCSQHQAQCSGPWERLMTQYPQWSEELKPDLMITVGLSHLSKSLHKTLRELKLPHWHISPESEVGNPFGTKLEHKCHYEVDFLAALDAILPQEYRFGSLWKAESQAAQPLLGKRPQEYAEAQILLESLSSDSILHLGNSMPIRYASWFGKLSCEVRSNRGTSGIDGSLSTAIGAALAMPNKNHVLLLGDVSFIYDQHGLWANPRPQNLSIWVLNNGGGRIFEQIEGPGNWAPLQQRISSPHQVNLQALCEQYGVSYLRCSASECIDQAASQGLRVVEIPCHESSTS